VGMAQGGIGKDLAAGGINNDHKADGHSSENIQGKAPGRGWENGGFWGLRHAM
jgi:hypothetical protein